MATRVFDGIKFCVQFLKWTSQGTFQPSLVQIGPAVWEEKMFNPFPNKPWFLRVCSICLLKTLWEKGKLLVTSNFSYTCSVFHPFRELSAIFTEFEIVVCKLFQFEGVKNVSLWKGLKKLLMTQDAW